MSGPEAHEAQEPHHERQPDKYDEDKPSQAHPFVRLGKFIVGGIAQRGKNKRAKAAKKKEEAKVVKQEERLKAVSAYGRHNKKKKPGNFISRLFSRKKAGADDDDSDSDEDDAAGRRGLDDDDIGNVSDDDDESEEYDPAGEIEDYGEDDEAYMDLPAFRAGGEKHPNFIREPIERLGPEDLKILAETVIKMAPKYKKCESKILDEKLENAVIERLKRLKPATHINGLVAFGAIGVTPQSLGNIKVPTLITVFGHNGIGGNIGVNGVYERYPDNYHGRAVYQKYLERDEWVHEPQQAELKNGQRVWANVDLDESDVFQKGDQVSVSGREGEIAYGPLPAGNPLGEGTYKIVYRDGTTDFLTSTWIKMAGARTFPTVHDPPDVKKAMRKEMKNVRVYPAKKAPGSVGHFRFVDKCESWFIFFDNLLGAWCIGPKPGFGSVFARCYGVDEAIPDGLGPERWQVFDVGQRIWHTHKHLQTLKGGVVSSAICG